MHCPGIISQKNNMTHRGQTPNARGGNMNVHKEITLQAFSVIVGRDARRRKSNLLKNKSGPDLSDLKHGCTYGLRVSCADQSSSHRIHFVGTYLVIVITKAHKCFMEKDEVHIMAKQFP
ncbi:predicted protein [Coccidioides posadasii str. Silveira]|uniref:Predicted protein n=1 Tax=Coccidioides posadasii (strain RMSCC 757 / Silveira) TaxID=443226 RepID=E9D7W9_COCPS|nr:predicted protein [Coccidioides posadasii str. Silveira]